MISANRMLEIVGCIRRKNSGLFRNQSRRAAGLLHLAVRLFAFHPASTARGSRPGLSPYLRFDERLGYQLPQLFKAISPIGFLRPLVGTDHHNQPGCIEAVSCQMHQPLPGFIG